MKKNYIWIITFFSFSGFYAVLAVILYFGLKSTSRVITLPIRLLCALLMAFIIVKILKSIKLNIEKKIIYLLFICYWIIYFIKVLYHYNCEFQSIRLWTEYVFYAIIFCILPFLTYSLIDFKKHKKHILNSLIFSGFLLGLVSIVLYRDILLSGVSRISLAKYSDFEEETISPLALSYTGCLTIALTFFQLVFKKNKATWYKIYLLITLVLSAIIFYLGASRGSVVALVFSFFLFFIFNLNKSRIKFFVLSLLAIPVLIWGAVKSGSSIFQRTLETSRTGEDSGRSLMWKQALEEFSNFPFLGRRIEIDIYPHNFIIESLMATGILGTSFLILLLLFSFIRMKKLVKLDVEFIWVYIVLIQGIVQHSFSGALYTAVLVFLPLGLTFSKSIINDKVL